MHLIKLDFWFLGYYDEYGEASVGRTWSHFQITKFRISKSGGVARPIHLSYVIFNQLRQPSPPPSPEFYRAFFHTRSIHQNEYNRIELSRQCLF